MCRCTPAIRTPFCGAPGCEWPMNDEQAQGHDVSLIEPAMHAAPHVNGTVPTKPTRKPVPIDDLLQQVAKLQMVFFGTHTMGKYERDKQQQQALLEFELFCVRNGLNVDFGKGC